MKFLLISITAGLMSVSTHGQEKTKQDLFKPFTILIIKPFNANIADSLMVFADSIERDYRQGYASSIANMEKLKEYGTNEAREKIDLEILEMRSREKQSHGFKYYHTVANKTFFELRTLFNTNYWEPSYFSRVDILDGDVLDTDDLVTHDLDALRKHYRVDYTVTFENIRTGKQNGVLTLEYVITLFSRKESKVILRKDIVGNAPVNDFKLFKEIFPPGNFHEFGVHCDNYLECAFTSAIRFSTEELFKAISVRQQK